VPEAVATRLNQSLSEVKRSDDFKKFLVESAALPDNPMTLAQADSFYQSEMQKFRAIAKAIKLEAQ